MYTHIKYIYIYIAYIAQASAISDSNSLLKSKNTIIKLSRKHRLTNTCGVQDGVRRVTRVATVLQAGAEGF